MNVIQKQAQYFYTLSMRESRTKYHEFVNVVKHELLNYHKPSHKLEFLDWILSKLKLDYDNHFKTCDNHNHCQSNETYEHSIFFLQIEHDIITESITDLDFSSIAKTEMDLKLDEILKGVDKLQLGQEISYDDLIAEIKELKEFYFLNKKNWNQLLAGKILEFTAAGLVSETLSKTIMEILNKL